MAKSTSPNVPATTATGIRQRPSRRQRSASRALAPGGVGSGAAGGSDGDAGGVGKAGIQSPTRSDSEGFTFVGMSAQAEKKRGRDGPTAL